MNPTIANAIRAQAIKPPVTGQSSEPEPKPDPDLSAADFLDFATQSPLARIPLSQVAEDAYKAVAGGVSAPDSDESGFKDASVDAYTTPLSSIDFLPKTESLPQQVDLSPYTTPLSDDLGIQSLSYPNPFPTDVPDTSIMPIVKHKGGNWDEVELQKQIDRAKLGSTTNDWETAEPEDPAIRAAGIREEIAETEADTTTNFETLIGRDRETYLGELRNDLQKNEIRAEINDWLDTRFKKYVKSQMGTREDPMRELAKTKGLPIGGGDFENTVDYDIQVQTYLEQAESNRKSAARAETGAEFLEPEEGYAGQGFTPAEQYWETIADASIRPSTIADYSRYIDELMGSAFLMGRELPSWFDKLTHEQKLNQTINVPWGGTDLGTTHVLESVQEAMSENSNLPDNLKIAPGKLHKMSVPDVYERAMDIDAWRVEQRDKELAIGDSQGEITKEFGDGYTIQRLTEPDQIYFEKEKMGHSMGGYLPEDYPKHAGDQYYGKGGWKAIEEDRVRVYSLRDSKGVPHVSIEAEYGIPDHIEDYIDETVYPLSDYAALTPKATLKEAKDAKKRAKDEWVKNNPNGKVLKIYQVKAKGPDGGNSAASGKYQEMVQDWLENLPYDFEFSTYPRAYQTHGKYDMDSAGYTETSDENQIFHNIMKSDALTKKEKESVMQKFSDIMTDIDNAYERGKKYINNKELNAIVKKFID